VNEALKDEPALINSDPFGAGWFIKVRPSNVKELDDLLSAENYEVHVKGIHK